MSIFKVIKLCKIWEIFFQKSFIFKKQLDFLTSNFFQVPHFGCSSQKKLRAYVLVPLGGRRGVAWGGILDPGLKYMLKILFYLIFTGRRHFCQYFTESKNLLRFDYHYTSHYIHIQSTYMVATIYCRG